MELVLDHTDSQIAGAFFEGNKFLGSFAIPPDFEQLKKILSEKKISSILVCSDQPELFKNLGTPVTILDPTKTKVTDTKNPKKIANIYGSSSYFPTNDCIVISIEKGISFDYSTSNGHYQTGVFFPLGTPIADTGVYWGLLGAIERITSEMRQTTPSPSDVKVVATGSGVQAFNEEDLKEIVDRIDPALTLIGLHEIMKENNHV